MKSGSRFDLSVFVGNAAIEILLFAFDASSRLLPTKGLAISGFIALCVGSGLKRQPLRSRRPVESLPPLARSALATGFLLLFAESTMLLLVGLGRFSPWLFAPALLPIVLTLIALDPSPLQQPIRSNWAKQELIADLLLGFAAVAVLHFFDSELAQLFRYQGPGPHVRPEVPRISVMAMAAFMFLLFYIPPRLLVLVEDGARWRTWLRMAAAISPLMMQVAMTPWAAE